MTEKLLKLFAKAVEIRLFENEIAALSEEGKVPGLVHLCSGAEVFESAVCISLKQKVDFVIGSHRSHGLALAMGESMTAVAAEILGKAAGLSKGLGGTQHLMSAGTGFLSSNGIVGGQVPLAAGAALSAKTLKSGGIGVCFFGDGAANQGAVLETMNLAVALELPLLFVLENNGFGQSTTAEFASGGVKLSDRAAAFGLKACSLGQVDANTSLPVIEEIIADVRETNKPAFIEAFVPRLAGHYHGEKADYLKHTSTRNDPLEMLAQALGPKVDLVREQAKAKVLASIKTALASGDPTINILDKFDVNCAGESS